MGAGSRVSLHDYLLDVDAVVATVEVCMCQSVARLCVCVCVPESVCGNKPMQPAGKL